METEQEDLEKLKTVVRNLAELDPEKYPEVYDKFIESLPEETLVKLTLELVKDEAAVLSNNYEEVGKALAEGGKSSTDRVINLPQPMPVPTKNEVEIDKKVKEFIEKSEQALIEVLIDEYRENDEQYEAIGKALPGDETREGDSLVKTEEEYRYQVVEELAKLTPEERAELKESLAEEISEKTTGKPEKPNVQEPDASIQQQQSEQEQGVEPKAESNTR